MVRNTMSMGMKWALTFWKAAAEVNSASSTSPQVCLKACAAAFQSKSSLPSYPASGKVSCVGVVARVPHS